MDLESLNNGEWQNFLYLLLLLVVSISGLFIRRSLPIRKIVGYLVIWSAVGIVTILIYSYRYEFSDIKNRFLTEVNPTKARMDKSGRLIISAAQDGHFYLDTKINGFNVRFMVDTGASDITLNIKEAAKIGIDTRKLLFNKIYQTANGESFGANIVLKEIQIGEVKFYNIPASVNSSEMGVSLLGINFLRKLKKYEFYRDKLVLTI